MAKYPLVTVSVGGQEEGAVGGFIVERGLARQSEMFDRQGLEETFPFRKVHAVHFVNAKTSLLSGLATFHHSATSNPDLRGTKWSQ